MKQKLAIIAAVALLVTGCHSITLTTPGGATAKVWSIGQRVTIGGLAFGTNGVAVTNYNNDQVAGLQAAFAAGLQAAKTAAVP